MFASISESFGNFILYSIMIIGLLSWASKRAARNNPEISSAIKSKASKKALSLIDRILK